MLLLLSAVHHAALSNPRSVRCKMRHVHRDHRDVGGYASTHPRMLTAYPRPSPNPPTTTITPAINPGLWVCEWVGWGWEV